VSAIGAAERELALDEVRLVRASTADEGRRRDLDDIVEALEDGRLADDSHSTLERIVTLGLQSGRIRAVYGPAGEQAALRLYRRLPEGAAVRESAEAVSEALQSLRGKELESASIAAVGPGSFALTLTAGGLELSVRLDRQGVRLGSVGV
jgi:hypothetical protein